MTSHAITETELRAIIRLGVEIEAYNVEESTVWLRGWGPPCDRFYGVTREAVVTAKCCGVTTLIKVMHDMDTTWHTRRSTATFSGFVFVSCPTVVVAIVDAQELSAALDHG